MTISDADWEAAIAHLEEYEQAYQDIPLQSSWFALGMLAGLRKRYEEGERTKRLYDAIMEVE